MDNFGIKIGIEGEKEFKKALSDINQSFKVLGSEMKLVESAFDKQDKSVTALTARNEVLGKQIDEQKNKVSTLEQALANAASSFGENDRRTQAWAVQLNHAKADLNNLQRELSSNEKTIGGLGDELTKAEDDTNRFDDALNKSADTAEDAGNRFSALGGVVAGIGAAMATAFAAITTAAVSAGKALVDMSTSGAAYADEVLTTSTQTGIATDKLQEYMYAAELVDVSVDTLTGSMAKQIKSMKSAQDGSASASEAYKKLGVTVTNADGSLRDSDAVYWETIDALGKMKNETERDALAMTLLGKSAQELNPLIEAGGDRMSELGAQAQAAGYVLSDQLLAAYGALDDQLQYLSVGATAAKNALGTVLLPVLTDLAGEGTALLGEFTTGILEANGDMGKITQVVGDVLPKALNTIMAYVPSMLSLVLEIVSSFGKTLVDNLPMLVETAGQIVFALLEGMVAALPQLTEGAIQLVLSLVQGIMDNLPQLMEAAILMMVTLALGLSEALPELIPSMVQAVILICETLLANMDQVLKAAFAIIQGLAEGILNALPQLIEALPRVISTIISFLTNNLPQILKMGVDLIISLSKGLIAAIPKLVIALPQIIAAIVGGLGGAVSSVFTIGKQIVEGLWQGIQAMGAWIKEKVSGFFQGIVDRTKSALGIHSPSTVFAEIGGNMAAGIGVGFEERISKVAQAIEQAIPTSFGLENAFSLAYGPAWDGSNRNISIEVPLTLDGVIITKSTGRIQHHRNQTYARALGVTV